MNLNIFKFTGKLIASLVLALVVGFSLWLQPNALAQEVTPAIPQPVITPLTPGVPVVQSVSYNVQRLLQTKECVGCNLTGALLKDVNLQGANLESANLQGADLERTNLAQTNLKLANLTGADLEKTNLSGADLTDANLFDADLEKANLQGANLLGANLLKADLEKANIQGVKGVNLQATF